MITLEEARRIAAEWLDDISGCEEYTTAWVFFNPRSAESIGGWDASVAVLKEDGTRCGMTAFISDHGGEPVLRGREEARAGERGPLRGAHGRRRAQAAVLRRQGGQRRR